MQRIHILGILLGLTFQVFGQTNLETTMIFGGNSIDEAKDIAVNQTKTALFFGARTFSNDGNIPANAGGSDFWIMKRNIDGTLIWSKTFGGNSNDDLETVMPHPDGGVIAFGTTRTDQGLFGDINGLAGGWLMRTNTNGTIIDGKIFGGTITETAVDAYRHLNGDITMVMEAGSPLLDGQTNNGILDAWIVQVEPSFAIKWSLLLGGSGTDVPDAITSDINGNVYVAATSNSNLPGLNPNHGGKDIWIFKIGPNGELLWQKTLGGTDDEESTDIVFHEDGGVYVMAQSKSSDGDFDENDGLNDLWVIRLNAEDGAIEGKYHFGGSGNDFGAHADLYGDDQLFVTATSTSVDIDLTGNKGFGDVWTFNMDLAGHLLRQMNYGGSQNDLAADILTIDSVFYGLATTTSQDKNVPFNTIAQQDTWFFTLNPNPDTCSDQFLCEPDSMLTNHIYPPDNESLVCASGCNAGYGPGPDFNTGNCPDFINPTAYFFVTTDTFSDLLTLSVNSFEFNQPQIALLKSVNCTSFQQVKCGTGSNGSVVLQYIAIDPKATYVVAVSDVEGNIGEFELCATTVNVEFCNKNDVIYATHTSLNSPAHGPYKPGEEVTFCYELRDWNKLECNGFQGLVPSFGPGWDPASFDLFGEPLQTDSLLAPATVGFWQWYEVGKVHYNITNPINGYDGGQGMPAGWYFTNTADPPPATNPDETTGDIDDCLPTSDKWKVCFTLKVVDECESNLDCSIGMKTFSDGEIGIDPSLACAYDQEEVFTANMVCCLNPNMQNIQNFSSCSGDTIDFQPQTNLLPPVTYTWIANADPFISGATPGTNQNQFYQILTNDAAIPLKVRYSIRAQNADCQTEIENFEVTVIPKPTCRISVSGPNIVCSGSTVTFNFESTGTPPFAIGLYRDNEFFANILSETNFLSIPIDPVFSGKFRVGTLQDAFCEGSGTGFVNVTVKPIQSSNIDTTICEGEAIIIGTEVFTEPGSYVVTLENGGSNNCDSVVVLNLDVAPSMTEVIDEVICNGDTLFVLDVPYTETTDEVIEYTGPEGCPNYIELHLLVKDTFSMEIEQTICYGDTLVFGGIEVYEPGAYSFVEETKPGCYQETILHLSVLPAIFINDLQIIADDGGNNGAILVEIKGGSPPFQYLWSNGATSESIFNVKHGNYTLTVTDRLGCDQTFDFEIPFVSGTSDLTAGNQDIMIWPTLAKTNDKIIVVNSGKENHVIKRMGWYSTQGSFRGTDQILTLPAGSNIAVNLPDGLSPGMYLVRIDLQDGLTRWAKIVLTE